MSLLHVVASRFNARARAPGDTGAVIVGAASLTVFVHAVKGSVQRQRSARRETLLELKGNIELVTFDAPKTATRLVGGE